MAKKASNCVRNGRCGLISCPPQKTNLLSPFLGPTGKTAKRSHSGGFGGGLYDRQRYRWALGRGETAPRAAWSVWRRSNALWSLRSR